MRERTESSQAEGSDSERGHHREGQDGTRRPGGTTARSKPKYARSSSDATDGVHVNAAVMKTSPVRVAPFSPIHALTIEATFDQRASAEEKPLARLAVW